MNANITRKALWLGLLFLTAGSQLKAQSKGNVQGGLRFGLPLGVTARYFFSNADAVEGIAGFNNQTFTVTGLYERHFDLSALTTQGFAWYIGGGAHMGSRRIEGSTRFIGGIDGIAGVDYTFPSIPLNLSLDWKPAVHFTTPSDLTDFAVSVRYIFVR